MVPESHSPGPQMPASLDYARRNPPHSKFLCEAHVHSCSAAHACGAPRLVGGYLRNFHIDVIGAVTVLVSGVPFLINRNVDCSCSQNIS